MTDRQTFEFHLFGSVWKYDYKMSQLVVVTTEWINQIKLKGKEIKKSIVQIHIWLNETINDLRYYARPLRV